MPLRQLRHGICVAKMLDNVGLRYPHRASGAKAPRTLRPLPLLRFAVSATGGAHLCSIQYYLRFWLGICRTSLAVSALRIMRYCPNSNLVMGINSAPARCLVLYFKAKYPAQPHKIALSTNKQFFLKILQFKNTTQTACFSCITAGVQGNMPFV